jgi:tetratricopeptide (TPR) repeat protein
VTAVQSLEAIGLKDASVVENAAGFSIQLSDLSHEDLAYGYMARLRREGFSGVSMKALATSETATKDSRASEEVSQFEEKTLVDRHMELLGSGSSRSEEDLWAAVDALVPDTTGEEWPHGVAQAVPLIVEIKTRFPASSRGTEASALLAKYYGTTGWRTTDKTLRAERYLTARQQFQEVLRSTGDIEEAEEAQMRVGYLSYGLRLLHPDQTKRIAYLHNAHEAFLNYLNQFSSGKNTDRAQLEVAGIVFELAKIGEIQYEDALAETRKIEAQFPDASEYAASRSRLIEAEILGRLGRQEEAIAVCKSILSDFSNNVRTSLCTAHQYKADCLFALGRYEDALRVYQEVLDTYSEEDTMIKNTNILGIMCNHFIGQCYEKLGQPEKARERYRRVLEIDPESGWAPITRQ